MIQSEMEQAQAQQQIGRAIQRGIKLLTSEDVSTPNSWNADLNVLLNILIGLDNGALKIADGPNAPKPDPDAGSGTPPPPPPGPEVPPQDPFANSE